MISFTTWLIIGVAVAGFVFAICWRLRRMHAPKGPTTGNLPAPPESWGADPLTSFLDLTRHQHFATFVNMRPLFDKMLQVDGAFVRLHRDLTDPEDLVGPFFSLPAHAALRAAAGLAMSTQISPAFAAMRQCLEAALYGAYINQNPNAFETWVKRIQDDASRQKMKKEFTIANLRKTLETVDPATFALWSRLYEKTIDFGAHPNPSALLSALKKQEHDKGIRWEVSYLTKEPEVIRGTMKSVAQVGIVCLRVFRHVYPNRFENLGLTKALEQLQHGL